MTRGRDFEPEPSRTAVDGFVYLLHFDSPIGNPDNPLATALHYTGWATDTAARIAQHASGHSDAKIMAYLVGTAGVGFRVAKVWDNVTRCFERQLKNRGSARRYCPICRHEVTLTQAPHFGPVPAAFAAVATLAA